MPEMATTVTMKSNLGKKTEDYGRRKALIEIKRKCKREKNKKN